LKLSMWMIANQLISLEPELKIADDAPVILNSARLAYATNCVHIYQENGYVVCNGEGNIIKIFDMEIKRVLELIQGIFDTYEDWANALNQHIRQKEYQAAIDEAWKIFKNPMILLDANNKVLGMTKQYGENAIDSEWAYLYRYGFSSLNAIKHMRHTQTNYKFLNHGQMNFQWKNNNFLQYPGISYCMYFNDLCCGRINVLTKDRPLNPGDAQLLQYVCSQLEPSLGQVTFEDFIGNSGSVFINLLHNKPFEKDKLEVQLHYQNWKPDDTYHLALVHPIPEIEGKNTPPQMNTLFQLISMNIPQAVILRQPPYIIILTANHQLEQPQTRAFLEKMVENNPVHVGFSLALSGILHLNILYKQAEYAISNGPLLDPGKALYSFWNYAVDYMVLSDMPLEEKIYACLPQLVAMWKLKQEKGDVMFRTLECFLDCERSISLTSQLMFLHKNTASYRIKKAQEFLGWDLNDPEIRRYCMLSIRILNLYEKLVDTDPALI